MLAKQRQKIDDRSPTTSHIKIKEIKSVVDNEIVKLMRDYNVKKKYIPKINSLMNDKILKIMQ